MPAPTIGAAKQQTPNATVRTQGGQAPAASPVIPFTRASRRKTRLLGQLGPQALGAGLVQLPVIQVPATGGYLRAIRVQVTGTTSANAATVVFQNDAPFNVLQNIQMLAANGDTLISNIDGFALAMLNKYGCFSQSSPNSDPVDVTFFKTPGAVAAGGSFNFNVRIPVEVDARDGLAALANMAANQSFMLQFFLNTIAQVYSTAPTTPPNIVIKYFGEYWSLPADTNGSGVAQATAPPGNGTVSLIQTQTPAIVGNSDQVVQLLNVGYTLRFMLFILRTSAGVRTDADWPALFNVFVNNDLWFATSFNDYQEQISERYAFNGVRNATVTGGAQDIGVFPFSEFIANGSGGDEKAQATCNRNEWLVTNSATALNVEAANWGAAASQLLVVTNSIRPSDPSAIYQPFLI